MKAVCRIKNVNGVDTAFNKNGDINRIYNLALQNGFDNTEALGLFLVSELPSFNKVKADNSLESVMKYAQEMSMPDTNISTDEIFDLKLTLERTNQKLSTLVRKIEDPEMRLKVQAFIDQGGVIEPQKKSTIEYTDDKGQKVTKQQVENEIVQNVNDFTNANEIDNAVISLPYPEYVEQYLSSPRMQNDLQERLSVLRRVPTLAVENDSLVQESRRKTVLQNTIQVGLSPAGIRSMRRIISGIPLDIWNENQTDTRELVAELEKEYAKLGLDIVGLKDTVFDKDALEVFISVTERMIKRPDTENQQDYLDELDAIFPEQSINEVIKVPNKHKGKTLVYFDTNLSHAEVFDKFRMFPVSGNVFHKVSDTLTENDVLETFYQRMLNSEVVLPQSYQTTQDPTNIEDKPNVLADIRVYLSEYKGRFYSEQNNVLASGVELLMDHRLSEQKTVKNVKTDPEYLKSQFVTDFNQYILEEKLKDSNIYRHVLSNFYVGNSDIVLNNTVESINGIKFEQELKDYIILRKDPYMDYLAEDVISDLVTEDIQTLNDPSKVSSIPSDNVSEGDYIMTQSSPSLYYRVGNSLYRKVKEDTNYTMYRKVRSEVSPLYFDTNTDFSVPMGEVNSVFKRLGKLQELKNSTKIFNSQPSILKNQINFLRLYSEQEQKEIDNKIDRCNG